MINPLEEARKRLQNQAEKALEQLLRDHKEREGVWPKCGWYFFESYTENGENLVKAVVEVGDKPDPRAVIVYHTTHLE